MLLVLRRKRDDAVDSRTLYVHAFETLRTAALLQRISLLRRSEPATLADFRAIFRSPAPLSYHALLIYSRYLRSLAPQFADIRRDPTRKAALDETFSQSFRVVEREARRDPQNERIAVHKGEAAELLREYLVRTYAPAFLLSPAWLSAFLTTSFG